MIVEHFVEQKVIICSIKLQTFYRIIKLFVDH